MEGPSSQAVVHGRTVGLHGLWLFYGDKGVLPELPGTNGNEEDEEENQPQTHQRAAPAPDVAGEGVWVLGFISSSRHGHVF